MATYIVTNTHRPDECEALNEEVVIRPLPRALSGTAFLCTCPSGTHGGMFPIEAASEADALAALPPRFRDGARIYVGDVLTFGKEIPVATGGGGPS